MTGTGEATTTAKKQCFVVGPIGAATSDIRIHSDWLLHEIIEPVMREKHPDYDTIRADKISEPGMIDSQIITKLLDADLVIADMTTLNANAFYEMGIRHMAQKPTIHMFLEGTEIPFDVKPYRAISFSLRRHSDIHSARNELEKALADALAPGHEVENPVTRARGKVQLRQNATSTEKVLMDQLEELKRSVHLLSRPQSETAHSQRRFLEHKKKRAINSVVDVSFYQTIDTRITFDMDLLAENYGGKTKKLSDNTMNFDFPHTISQGDLDEFISSVNSYGDVMKIEMYPF